MRIPVWGRIVQSRFGSAAQALKVDSEDWGSDEEKEVTATYAVPKGFREGSTEQFYGYVIKVFYHDVLQDQEARPKTLLAPPAASAEAEPVSTADGSAL